VKHEYWLMKLFQNGDIYELYWAGKQRVNDGMVRVSDCC